MSCDRVILPASFQLIQLKEAPRNVGSGVHTCKHNSKPLLFEKPTAGAQGEFSAVLMW